MDLFPLSFVLRGFSLSPYYKYASNEKPCAALLSKKISHFWIKNEKILIFTIIGGSGILPQYSGILTRFDARLNFRNNSS
jgi:hypothetical protein